MLALASLLPLLPSENSGSASSIPVLMCRPALMAIYLLLILVVTAQFTVYSYIEPFVQAVGGQDAHVTTLVLLLFGGMGIVGSVLFSAFNQRFPQGLLRVAIAVMAISLGLLLPVVHAAWGLYGVSVVWGVAMMCMVLSMQAKVLALAHDATDVGMSLFSGIFNIGIGAGALLGSQVSLHMGMQNIGWVGAALALAGLVWCVFAQQRWAPRR